MVTPVKAGLETMLQLVPFQCSTSASGEPLANPTAQALSGAGAVTPVSWLPWGSLGPGVTLQLVPSQCSISGRTELPWAWSPTAHTLLLAAPATSASEAFSGGVGTTLQLVPLKCSARVCEGPVAVPILPTAHMSPGAITAAPARDELLI